MQQQLRLSSAESACRSPSALRCRVLTSTSAHRAGEPECQVRGTWVHCNEPGIWATRRLATLLRGTQAARHGEAGCRLCEVLLLGCAAQCAAAHGPRVHVLSRRKMSKKKDAKQMAAGRLQALGTAAVAECDAARTASKTWCALPKSAGHTGAQTRRVHGASDSSLAYLTAAWHAGLPVTPCMRGRGLPEASQLWVPGRPPSPMCRAQA